MVSIVVVESDQKHPGIKRTINLAEDNSKQECRPDKTKPIFNPIHPLKRHMRGCDALEYGLVSLGLHCFLRLAHALSNVMSKSVTRNTAIATRMHLHRHAVRLCDRRSHER